MSLGEILRFKRSRMRKGESCCCDAEETIDADVSLSTSMVDGSMASAQKLTPHTLLGADDDGEAYAKSVASGNGF